MNDFFPVILNEMPMGVIILDRKMGIVYSNRQAANFLKRHELPDEIAGINRRIVDAIDNSRFEELFPGEIYIFKKIEGSPSNWIFKFFICERPRPLVGIFIIEEKISHKLDLNKIRQEFRLTRREIDVLRRVLDGFKNTEIADDLEITEQTVKDHLTNIYMKFGVTNRFTLVRSLMNSQELPS
jgi:DNA-binding CsgD family transcriptional regulator